MTYVRQGLGIGVIISAALLLAVSLQRGNCLLAVSNAAIIAVNIHIFMLNAKIRKGNRDENA